MFYKTAKLRNMLNRLEKRAFAARAGVNLVKALLGSGAQTGIKAIPKTLGAVAPKIEGALGGATEKLTRTQLARQAMNPIPREQQFEQLMNKPLHEAFSPPFLNTPLGINPTRTQLARQAMNPIPREQQFEQMMNKPLHEVFSPPSLDFPKYGHDQRFREKRAIAALIGPLFRAASRAPLTTAAVGLGGMAGYEFARQPKKLANPALLPNASTAPPPNNDAALQKTSLDRQILSALLRR